MRQDEDIDLGLSFLIFVCISFLQRILRMNEGQTADLQYSTVPVPDQAGSAAASRRTPVSQYRTSTSTRSLVLGDRAADLMRGPSV